ncbi:MAG: hypothetical protein AAGF11_05850 [Myxococcota bacterium]
MTTIEKGWVDWLGAGYLINDTTALLYPRGRIALTPTGKPFVFHGYPAAIRRHLEKRPHIEVVAGSGGHVTVTVHEEAPKASELYAKEVFMGLVGPMGAVAKVATGIPQVAVMSIDLAIASYDAVMPSADGVSTRPSRAKVAWQAANPSQSRVFVTLDWCTPTGDRGIALEANEDRPMQFHDLSQVLRNRFGL